MYKLGFFETMEKFCADASLLSVKIVVAQVFIYFFDDDVIPS